MLATSKTTCVYSLPVSLSAQITLVSVLLCLFISKTVTHSHSHRSGVQAQLVQRYVGLIHPEQIHIAFGKTSQDVVIMWASRKDAKFNLEIARTSDQLQKIEADSFEMKQTGIMAAKYLHRVYLSNLLPGEKYVYRIVGQSGANSKIFSFKVPDNKPKKVHIFMILADMGLSTKSFKFLTYEAANGMYEAVFHVGDIAYSLHRDNGNFGDTFLKETEKFAAKVPYMTVPGDHERFQDYFHYRHRFSMPNAGWPMPADKLWYSIDIGPIHFIALNTEVFYTQTDQQKSLLEWLQDDLYSANVRRSQHPWIIVLGHKPMYCSPTDDSFAADCANDNPPYTVRSSLEDLFFEEGVDLYISGHQHNYERSWPVYRSKVFQRNYINPKAPVHIINGAFGYQYLTETFLTTKAWSAFSSSDPKKELYGKLEVLNSTHLMWDVYCAENNENIDSVLIIQRRHGSFGKAGDDAYNSMVKLLKLPPAPFHWQPSTSPEEEKTVFQALYALPPSTRKIYLLCLCYTLMGLLVILLCIPRVRRTVCRAAKR